MSKPTYHDKLKSPMWQKRRLELLGKLGFVCACCDDTESTLHVHHRYYEKNTDPWDYPDRAFSILCDHCHAAAHSAIKELQYALCEFPPGVEANLAQALYDLRSNDEFTLYALAQCARHEDLMREAWSRLMSEYADAKTPIPRHLKMGASVAVVDSPMDASAISDRFAEMRARLGGAE